MARSRRIGLFAIIFALVAFDAGAAPPDVPVYRSFQDWEVGCDNTRRCTAVGLQPEDYADVTAFLWVERAAGGGAAPTFRALLSKEGLAPGDPISLVIDGKPVPGVSSRRTIDNLESERAYPAVNIAAHELTPFVEALRSGRRLQLATNNVEPAEVSLDGAVAALLFIDDVQGRLDTTTALVRRGTQSGTTVPAAPAPPVVTPRPAAATETIDPGLAAALGKRLAARGSEDCDPRGEASQTSLGDGRALVGFACGGGAYNFATDYYIVEAGNPDRARPAAFRQPGEGTAGQDAVTNTLFGSDVDPATGLISFFSKGRGPGDCGSRGVYAWTGAGFEVVSYAAMHACRGVPDDFWPVLWRSATAAPR